MSISSSSSSSEPDGGNGMDRLFIVATCGLPLSFFRNASLYLMGTLGRSCRSLMVDAVEAKLPVDSGEDTVDSVLLEPEGLTVYDELIDERRDEGDGEPGDRLNVFVWA